MTDEELRRLAESFIRLGTTTDDLTTKLEELRIQRNADLLALAGETDATRKATLQREIDTRKSEILNNRAEQAYNNHLRSLGLVQNSLGEFEREVVKLSSAQRKRIAEETEIVNRDRAREKVQESLARMMADKTGSLISGFGNLGSALNKTIFDSTKGSGKYGDALDNFGKQVIDVGKYFGPFGKAVSGVTGGLLKLVGASLKQQETLNKAYENLSQFGAVDVSGIQGMFRNLQNLGFTVSEIDKFGDILKVASPNLATLGMTAAEGAKNFAATFAAIKNSNAERELRNLGFTSESMVKTFADYQGLMGRQGFIQGRSISEVARQSVQYAKTLDELTKLTGQSRDEVQKRMDADANDIKFRLYTQELERDGLTERANTLRKASVLMAEFSEDTASGFREMIANNGNVVGEASAKLMISTGNAAKQITEDLNAGKISHLEAARLIAVAKAEQVERFRAIGKIDADIMRELGLSVRDMDAINKYRGKTQKDLEKIEVDQSLQAKAALDRERAAEVVRRMTERNLEQSKDRLINLVGNQLAGAFEKLWTVLNSFTKKLAELLKKIGGPNFTDLFKTAEDYAEEMRVATEALTTTQQEISENNAAIEEMEANRNKKKLLEEELQRLRQEAEDFRATAQKARTDRSLTPAQRSEAYQRADTSYIERQRQIEAVQAQLREVKGTGRGTGEGPFGQDIIRDLRERNLEAEKKLQELRRQQETARRKFEETSVASSGSPGTLPQDPKVALEVQTLNRQREDLSDLLNDKLGFLTKQTLESLKFSEDDLKDEEKRKKFEEEFNKRKKENQEKLEKIEKRLIEIREEELRQSLSQVNRARTESQAQPTTMGPRSIAPSTGSTAGGPSYLQKVAQIESSGRAGAVNRESSAAGLFQFTQSTWRDTVKAMGLNYTDQDRFDPAKATEVAKFFTQGQSGQLKTALGRDPNDTELYLAHFLGATGAVKFLRAMAKNPTAPASEGAGERQIQSNPNIFYADASKAKLRSLQDVYDLMARKMDDAGALISSGRAGPDIGKVQLAQTPVPSAPVASAQQNGQPSTTSRVEGAMLGGILSGPTSGYPVMLHGRELILPMPNTTNLASVLQSVNKTELSNVVNTENVSNNGDNLVRQFATLQTDLINLISNKLDALDSRLARGNEIQENILTYSMA